MLELFDGLSDFPIFYTVYSALLLSVALRLFWIVYEESYFSNFSKNEHYLHLIHKTVGTKYNFHFSRFHLLLLQRIKMIRRKVKPGGDVEDNYPASQFKIHINWEDQDEKKQKYYLNINYNAFTNYFRGMYIPI